MEEAGLTFNSFQNVGGRVKRRGTLNRQRKKTKEETNKQKNPTET